jgi:hypothetical protein
MSAQWGLRLRAARHELRCWECRVTWRSLFQRLAGIKAGYTPTASPRLIEEMAVRRRRFEADRMRARMAAKGDHGPDPSEA